MIEVADRSHRSSDRAVLSTTEQQHNLYMQEPQGGDGINRLSLLQREVQQGGVPGSPANVRDAMRLCLESVWAFRTRDL